MGADPPSHLENPTTDSQGLPLLLSRYLGPGDSVERLAPEGALFLVWRSRMPADEKELLFVEIGPVSEPTRSRQTGDYFLCADLPGSTRPARLVFRPESVRSYFFHLGDETGPSLYELLGADADASPAQLRLAWRLCQLSSHLSPVDTRSCRQAEKAFNLLAHPSLRACYDKMRRDEQHPPLFPYGGFGLIVAAGRLNATGDAFFANRILAYQPETTQDRMRFLLRSAEFLPEHILLRDTRRGWKIWLDRGLVENLRWDVTWNRWKCWLRSQIEVEATFVKSGERTSSDGSVPPRACWTALPARTSVSLPADLVRDIQQAQALHALLGQNADLLVKARAEIERQPVEYRTVQDWIGRFSKSADLKPEHMTWRPDYDRAFFEPLKKRAKTWFLFRDEYLFVLASILVAEIPQPSHAAYVFRIPEDLDTFLRRYAAVSRDDIRRNRGNVGAELGFVGRVVHGTRKERWLADILKHQKGIADTSAPMEEDEPE